MKAIMAGVLMALSVTAATAADSDSASAMLPGCRAVLNGTYPTSAPMLAFVAGECFGVITTASNALAYQGLVCTPHEVIQKQLIVAVVRYIDQRSERLNEPFQLMVIQGLVAAWPCKQR
jgi:formate/nitrite transporter FocA (FNT family)